MASEYTIKIMGGCSTKTEALVESLAQAVGDKIRETEAAFHAERDNTVAAMKERDEAKAAHAACVQALAAESSYNTKLEGEITKLKDQNAHLETKLRCSNGDRGYFEKRSDSLIEELRATKAMYANARDQRQKLSDLMAVVFDVLGLSGSFFDMEAEKLRQLILCRHTYIDGWCIEEVMKTLQAIRSWAKEHPISSSVGWSLRSPADVVAEMQNHLKEFAATLDDTRKLFKTEADEHEKTKQRLNREGHALDNTKKLLADVQESREQAKKRIARVHDWANAAEEALLA